MTKSENETVIRFDETDDPAIVYTASRFVKNKMDRLVENGNATLRHDFTDGWEYEVPKSFVVVRPKRKVVVTDEMRDRLSSMRKRTL